MLNIGIVGCGSWSKKIIKEINNNKKFKLTSIVCRNKNLQNKIKVFKSIENMVCSDINDCIYVAALPNVNLEVVQLVKRMKIPLILEKPLSNSINNMKKIKRIIKDNNLIIYPNLTNYYSSTFSHLKRFSEKNYSKIKRIIIYEGNLGPFRKNINPIWDWGFHSISLLYILFRNKRFTNISKKEIKTNNIYGKGLITKFSFCINKKIKVNIITGNLFKKKLRKIKIVLNNKDYIENDMVLHKIKTNTNIIHKRSDTPISILLNSFERSISLDKHEESRILIDASCKTIDFLEKFYKC